jgi:hypothetical protein
MKIIKSNILLFTSVFCFIYNNSQAQTFKNLFNGIDFSGWKKIGETAPFTIVDSCIVMHQKANTKEHSFLLTEKKYKDFILEMKGRRDPQFHYGILYRAIDAPDTAMIRLYGYQIKIDHDKNRRWTGAVFDDFGQTWRWMTNSVDNIPAQNALKNAGEWDSFRIEAIGNNIRVWVNDVPVTNMINGKYKEGHIALKIHFLGDKPQNEKYSAYIKDIRIQTKDVKKYAHKMPLPELKVD